MRLGFTLDHDSLTIRCHFRHQEPELIYRKLDFITALEPHGSIFVDLKVVESCAVRAALILKIVVAVPVFYGRMQTGDGIFWNDDIVAFIPTYLYDLILNRDRQVSFRHHIFGINEFCLAVRRILG